MQLNKYFLILVLALNNALFSNFATDTLVKTPDGYSAIKSLEPGDLIECCGSKKTVVSKVFHRHLA